MCYTGKQPIKQLEKRKGGYFYIQLDAKIVNQFSRKKATRLVCKINDQVTLRCGLNHLGDGNFFIIIAGRYTKILNVVVGDPINYQITEDPNQLGVDIPEVLTVFLEQDMEDKAFFNTLTDGKKRSLIYSITRIKDIDKQVQTISAFLKTERLKKIKTRKP
ncbi:hypothetical protein MHTCC0001_26310 [Flavobacteriaceae bacterium MHTCC 0001]